MLVIVNSLYLRDHSAKHYWGGGFSIFTAKIWMLPPLKIGRIRVPPPRGLEESGYPPPHPQHIIFFITPLHVFYGIIRAIQVFFDNYCFAKFGSPPPTNGEIWFPAQKPQ